LAAKSSLLPGAYTLTVTDNVAATASYTYDVSYIVTLSPINNNYDPVAFDHFGYSCAVDGQYMIVGANEKTVGALTRVGAAYVYKRSNTTPAGTWSYEAKFTGTGTADSTFGTSVAISGDTVVVGEKGGNGKAFVWYRSTGTTWTSQGTLAANDPMSGMGYGVSVAIDGDYIAVGACNWNGGGNPNQGAVYMYFRVGSTWAKQGPTLFPSVSQANAFFGSSVSLSGTTMAVGEYAWSRATPSAVSGCGCAHVFTRSGTTWSLQQQLLASDPSANDNFGYSVSIDGSYIVVGAYAWDSKTPVISDCGSAYVFVRNGSTWTQQAQLTAGDMVSLDNFGRSVDIYGSYAVIGAYQKTNYAGVSYIFKRTGTTWHNVNVLKASDGGFPDSFGVSVGISDKYVVSGAYGNGVTLQQQGSVYSSVVDYPVITPGTVLDTITARSMGSIGETLVTGGVTPYTISWTGLTSSDATAKSGLAAGAYTITVTDAQSRALTYTYTVGSSVMKIGAPGLVTHATAVGTATGAIAATGAATPGNGTYTYEWTWSSGASTITTPTTLAAKSSLLPGLYTVTATETTYGDTASYTYDVSYVVTLTPIVNTLDATANDRFGYSCAADGQYMIVGAYTKTAGANTGAGAAYVYKRSDTTITGTWAYEAKFTGTGTTNYTFGYCVAISGDTVVVGETGGNGKAFVWFRTTGTTWTSQGTLAADDPTTFMKYGSSVAIDGDYIAVGAFQWDGTYTDQGAVYMYLRTGSTWAKQGSTLFPSDPQATARFGIPVFLSGSTLVVGAQSWSRVTPSVITQCGCAYVFTRSGTTWTLQQQLVASDPTATDGFGCSVSIDGSYIVVGAYAWDSKTPAIVDCGCAYVFTGSGASWSLQQQLTAGDMTASDYFGISVDIYGTYAVVGAYGRTTNTGISYVFKRSGTTWNKFNVMKASNASTSDVFGISVSICDKYVVNGAYNNTVTLTNQGSVYATSLPPPPSGGSVTVLSTSITTASVTVAMSTLGTDDTYTYVVSRTSTNSSSATMTDCGNVTSQTASQTVSVTGLSPGTTYYIWVRAKASGGEYTVISSSASLTTFIPPSGGSITVLSATSTAASVAVTVSALGNDDTYTYVVSRTSTNSSSATMTDCGTVLSQTESQTVSVTGLSAPVAYYLWVRAKNSGGEYTVISSSTSLTTILLTITAGGVISNVSEYGATDGSISEITFSGGSPPFTYSWNSGTPDPDLITTKTKLSAGTYVLSVTDSMNVITEFTFVLTQPSAPSVYGGGASRILGLASAYIGKVVNVTDKFFFAAPFFHTYKPITNVTGTVVHPPKVGASGGSVSGVIVTGGVPPYTYSWTSTNVKTDTSYTLASDVSLNKTSTLSNARAGNYVLTVTDSVNQTYVYGITLSELSLTVGSIQDASSKTSSDGSISATVISGGSGSVTWTGVASTSAGAKENLAPGNYTVAVNDGSSTVSYTYMIGWKVSISDLVVASDYAADDNFGYSCSVYDDSLAVGTPNSAGGVGSVYLYSYDAAWTFVRKYVSDAPSTGFGSSVSIQGERLFVLEYGSSTVHVFEGTSVTQKLSGIAFGVLSTTLVVSDSTDVKFYAYESASFALKQTLSLANVKSVFVSPTYVALGIPSGNLVNVYTYSTNWTLYAALTSNDVSTDDNFGCCVAGTSEFIVVGATGFDSKGLNAADAGAVYAFTKTGTAWAQSVKFTSGDSQAHDYFGFCAAASENRIVVGSYHKTVGGISRGAAFVYSKNGTGWNRNEVILASDGAEDDYLGYSVAITSRYLVVGASGWE
jgi:hypothetical protein